MSRPRAVDAKQDYLQFLDVLYRARESELGKTGRTRISLSELYRIFLRASRLNEFLEQLEQDEIIDSRGMGFTFDYKASKNDTFINTNGTNEIEVFCTKTKEQILEYKLSLKANYADLGIVPRVKNWGELQLIIHSDKVHSTVITRNHPNGYILDYKDMGFASKRNGKVNLNWVFLCLLAKNNGLLQKNDTELTRLFPDISKSKQRLKTTLGLAFGIKDDPFYPIRKYKNDLHLKFAIKMDDTVKNMNGLNSSFGANSDEDLEDYRSGLTSKPK